MTTYKSKGVPVPEPTDPNDPPAYVGALADWVNDRPGIQSMTTTQRNALTGQNLWPGRVIFNTTTQQHEANATGAQGGAHWDAVGTVGAWQSVNPLLQDRGGVNGAPRTRSWGNSAMYFYRRLVRDTWQVKGWVSLGSTCDLVVGGSNFVSNAAISFPDVPNSTVVTLRTWYMNLGVAEMYGALKQFSPDLSQLWADESGRPAYDNMVYHTSELPRGFGYVDAAHPWDWRAGNVIAIEAGFLA